MKKLLLILLLLSYRALAYDMPIGVPDAWIDPAVAAPARPSPWTTEQAGYYYVDWNTGTDSGRTYGTPSAPRKTIPNPVPAGSRVEMAAGNYGGGTHDGTEFSGAIELELVGGGTSATWAAGSAGPAWVVGQAGLTSVMTNSWKIRGSYIYIDGLKWPRIRYFVVQFGSSGADWATDHYMLRNCEIDGEQIENSFGLQVLGRVGFPQEHGIIYNNTIHGFGDMETLVDPDNNAIATGDYVFHFWVLHNTAHNCTAGIRFGAAGGADSSDTAALARYGYVADNTVHTILQAGLFVKYAKDTVFSSNHVYNIIPNSFSEAKCLGAQYAPDGLWIIYNRLEGNAAGDGHFGVYIPATDTDVSSGTQEPWPVYVIGNIISGMRHGSGTYSNLGGGGPAAITFRGSGERYAIGNTIYDVCSGIMTDGGNSYTRILNNIISGVTEVGSGATAGKHMAIGEDAADTYYAVNNNLYFQSGGTPQIRWNTGNYDLASFRAATTQGDNDAVGDPLFTNTATGDFTLLSGSPARDTGSATLIDTLEALYLSTFGVTLAIDYAGNARPANAIYDMGAYEYGSTFADSTPPIISSATIPTGGTTIVLAFSEAVGPGAGGSIGWALSLSSGSVTASYASGAGTSALTYNLSGTVNTGTTGTVSYTQPTNGIEDGTGNDLATLSGFAITNNSTAGGGGGGGAGTITTTTLNAASLSVGP